MTEISREVVTEFRSLVGMAETGEMQAAVETVGPFKVNPYYYKDPRMANIVGYFMNTVAPLAQSRHELGETSFRVNEAVTMARPSDRVVPVSNTVKLADKAGYLVKVSDDESSILTAEFIPTRSVLEVKPAEVCVTKYTGPELRGCLTGFFSGAVGTVALVSQIDSNLQAKPLIVASGIFFSIGAGSKLGEKYGRLQAGREAYEFYQSKLNQHDE